jgi:hypothetical protein
MKRSLALALAYLLAASQAHAQLLTLGVGPANPTAAAGYTGPGDIVGSAYAFVGLRAYSATYATGLGLAVKLCTSGDAICTDIHVTAAGGLNATDIATSTCTAIVVCTVKTFYDQSGNSRDFTQATEANRPTYSPNGVTTGVPSIICDASDFVQTGTVTNLAAPWTETAGGDVHLNPGGNSRVVNSINNPGLFASPGPQWSVFGGSAVLTSATVSLDTFYRVIGHIKADGTGAIVVNNTAVSGSPGNTDPGTSFAVCSSVNGGQGVSGRFVEAGIWAIEFDSTQVGNMDSNISAYWGF